jgi:[acyl-carrier-protein] S-malonyltransferase
MGKALAENFEESRRVFDEVSSVVSRDLRQICWEFDADTLRQTQNAQIALFTVSLASYRALRALVGVSPLVGAGHSVGEYAALAASGVLTIADAARLVQRRGDLMARAGNLAPGTMAAVLGLDDEVVERVCAECATEEEPVVPANYNSPGQVVISGAVPAVERACERLKAEGAKRCLPLNVSGAFHSPLMRDAADAFGQALAEVEFREGEFPVVSNVTAEPVTDSEAWRSLLKQQLASPVQWTKSVRRMGEMGAGAFLELGAGNVLCGLIKRTLEGALTASLERPEDLEAIRSLLGEGAKA